MRWPLIRLGDCCEVKSGATPKTDIGEYWGGQIRWATPKDISRLDCPYLFDTPEKITAEGFRSCSTQMLPVGTVLVSSRAPIGLVAIAGVEMCTNQGFKNLMPGPAVDSHYLYHCMKVNSARLAALGNGATFKEVSKSVVEDFEIPLPPIQEQQRIAAILDKADSMRRKRQEAIRLADEFLRAVFVDMFGKHPKTKVLMDYCEFLAGFAFKSEQYVSPDLGVRLLRGINVGIGSFEWSDAAGYLKDSTTGLDRYLLEAGDVVMAMDRPWISSGLKCAVVDQTVVGNYLVQRVARLRPKQPGSEMFIFNCLQGSDFKSHCRITETTIPHISPKDFATYPVPYATTQEISSFARLASKVRNMTMTGIAAGDLANQLQSSLQDGIFEQK